MVINLAKEFGKYEFLLEDTLAKAKSVIPQYDKPLIAYSGGSDSDVVMHLLREFGVKAVIYDTGIEWEATMRHAKWMQSQGYNIEIIKAERPVPISNKKYGHPFINKKVSEYLERLQNHNFQFQEHGPLPFSELYKMYPNCKVALRWWCNDFGPKSMFNIEYNKYLKEFLIEYGLPFKVSGKCCDGAKKMPVKTYTKKNKIDLMILGLRKAEGGVRVGAYNSCFSEETSYGYAMYRPLWFWPNHMKKWYTQKFQLSNSDCYTVYGLDRTGCAGCPYGMKFEDELIQLQDNEPKLAKGINNIFAPTYEWTREYNRYKASKVPTDGEIITIPLF